ncbi:hypothetical protein H257_14606 [Aphanomyces astaci]|uniref:Uncharacterized protein n=1 Tax=Aphanomyces astaci TaxID=112090 RepID=W4FQL3_APHAT|nr:hypothetical protein H257_14606 [Aphanomyces astaci]ETV69780.1 hypothetical protein H257_14606 [Aphanomyces astaci]|eukprot:XP_009840794.1 hypothetical protein H257_14606 [Aphanomyces astaci]
MVGTDGSINLAVFGYDDFTEFVLYKYKTAGIRRLCATETQTGVVKTGTLPALATSVGTHSLRKGAATFAIGGTLSSDTSTTTVLATSTWAGLWQDCLMPAAALPLYHLILPWLQWCS